MPALFLSSDSVSLYESSQSEQVPAVEEWRCIARNACNRKSLYMPTKGKGVEQGFQNNPLTMTQITHIFQNI